MSDELKPCPGCGREQWTDEQRGDIIPYRKNMRRRCDWCDLEMRDWNTRPLEDALRAELAAARAEAEKYRPIPVSERMPEYSEGKLNYVMLFDSIEKEWDIGRLVKLSNSRYQWSLETGIYWHDDNFGRITHWMPLPPAPEAPDEQA